MVTTKRGTCFGVGHLSRRPAVALERRGGGVYFYTSRRVSGRVVKEYGGSGRIAELAAQLDAADRELKWLDRRRARTEKAFFDAEITEVRDWLAAVDRVIAAVLERSGWHNVRRQWRRQRGATMTGLANTADLPWVSSELVAVTGEIDPETQTKADKGDKAALKAVDAYLDSPAARALWGDVGRHVLNTWAKQLSGGNELKRRAVLKFASDLRSKLAGPNPSALDTLLAERVVLAWLYLNWCEDQYVRQLDKLDWAGSDRHHKRIETTHRKLMTACRTLAKVKRSNLPDVLALVNVNPPTAIRN